MCSVFNDPKLAGEIGTFILSLTSMFYFLVTFSTDTSRWLFYLVCLMPQSAVSFTLMQRSSFMGGFERKFDMGDATYILIFDVFFYLALYLYLE